MRTTESLYHPLIASFTSGDSPIGAFNRSSSPLTISGHPHVLRGGPRDAGGAAPLAALPCQLQSCALPGDKTAECPRRIKPAANEKQTPPVLQLGEAEREGRGWRRVRWEGAVGRRRLR